MSTMVTTVIPACNEGQCLPELHRRLCDSLRSIPYEFEFIIVDDGSTDGTDQVVRVLNAADPRVRVLRLSRNFGHQCALLAGVEDAAGDAIVMMDADLQHPPEIIPLLLQRWAEGFEIVQAVRGEERHVSLVKRATSKVFYRVFSYLSGMPIEPGAADFRLIDVKVARALCALPERLVFLRGLFPWLGFRRTTVYYQAGKRHAGKTKYSLPRMMQFAVTGITSFSTVPLRLATMLGLLTTVAALSYGAYAAIARLVLGHTVPGWASLATVITGLFGIQFILLGVLGEYLAAVFHEVKQRPRYLIAERIGSVEAGTRARSSVHDSAVRAGN